VAPKAVGVQGPVQSSGATEVSATIADDVNAEVAEATVASPEPLPQSSENGGAASAEGLDAPASVDASEGGNRAFASSDEDGSTQEFSRFARDAAAAGAVSVATNRFWPPSGTPDALSFASRSEKLATQNAGGAVEGPQTESSLNSPFWRRSKAPVVPSDDALEARFEHDTPPAIGVDNESGGNFLEDVETTSQETDIMEDYQQRREGISRMAVAGLGVAAVLGGLGVLWATGFGSKKDPGKGLGDSVVQLDLQPGTGSEPAGGTGAGPSENPAAVTTSPDGTAGTEVPSDSGVNSRTSGTIGVSSSSPPVGATQTDVGTGVPTNAPHGDGAITAKVPETTSVLPAVRDLPKPTQGSQTSASSNSAAPGMDPLRVVDDSDLRALEKVPAVPPIPQGAQSLAKEELERLAALRTEALQSVRANATQVYRLAEEAIKARDAAANQLKSIEGTIEAVRQVCEPVIKQSAQTEQRLRQKQDELRRAEAAAIDAQRAAEAAKQSLSAVERSASEVLAKKAQADEQLKKVSDQISRIAGEREAYSQRFTKLTALRDQYDIKIREIDSQNRTLAGFVDKVRRAEMEKKRQANAGKIRELMDRAEPLKTKLKTLDDAIKKVETVSPDLAKTMRESYDREKAQLDGLLKEVAELNGGVPSDELALPESRGQQPTLSESGGKPVINGLKMRLVPVGDVYFSVYPTRVRDFEAFATERRLASSGWKNPGFKQTGDHPVVNVTWKEANGFCIWLTEKERKAGRIKGDQAYRLPTDLEWSMAVGLSAEEGATPAARDMGVDTQFPWGTQWPPPPKTANLSGEEMESSHAIAGYNDGYPNTSPVGMFGANEYGLYDMAGNVAQWTMDSWTPESPERVIRGSSWMQALRVAVLSSSRGKYKPDVGLDTVGFRVVLAPVQ
jgi:formylglycine-generating enzyme required for sulfatase activity